MEVSRIDKLNKACGLCKEKAVLMVNIPSKADVFFTSDCHFNHGRIIYYTDRPFTSTEDMNETLIRNWNNVVKNDSYVFILGDFCFGTHNAWEKILKRLNGRKYLILGNHDIVNLDSKILPYLEGINFGMVVTHKDKVYYLNHFPFLAYPGKVYQLYGHVHSSDKKGYLTSSDYQRNELRRWNQYDVGVDNNNFTPVSLKYLETRFELIKKYMDEDFLSESEAIARADKEMKNT